MDRGREIGGLRAVESLPHALESAIPLPHTHLACWCLLAASVAGALGVPPQQISVQATEPNADLFRQSCLSYLEIPCRNTCFEGLLTGNVTFCIC